MRCFPASSLSHLTLIALASACSDKGSSTDELLAKLDWHCSEGADHCSCLGLPPNADILGGFEAAACSPRSCCFVHPTKPEGVWECECMDSAACDAEVESRRETKRVDSCPPAGGHGALACATRNENCSPAYLADQELAGCCAGTSCKMGTDGVSRCQ